MAPEGAEVASINATWPPSRTFFIGAKNYLLNVDFCSKKITYYFIQAIIAYIKSIKMKKFSYFIGENLHFISRFFLQ